MRIFFLANEKKLADLLLAEIQAVASGVQAQIAEIDDGFVVVFDEGVSAFKGDEAKGDGVRQVNLARATARGFTVCMRAMVVNQKKAKHVHNLKQMYADESRGFLGSAVCTDCGKNKGWWCPDSPDHLCHYFSKEKGGIRVVRLSNGQVVPVPPLTGDLAGHERDPDNETEDECLFCGRPEERQ